MAVVLLVGAGLMIKSVGRLLGVTPGSIREHVLTMQISRWPGLRHQRGHRRETDEMVARLGALPGVDAAAAVRSDPARRHTATRGAFTSKTAAGRRIERRRTPSRPDIFR